MNKYTESKLNNGLSVITSENQYSNIVTISMWVRAGSRYENKNNFGYAHILEHMLLRGTKKRPSAFEISMVTDRLGAVSNAFTGQERIYFFIQVAKTHLEEVFELLADIILNPLFDPTVLENEKKVITQEFQRALDNPIQLLQEEAARSLFKDHPLSHFPLGQKEVILAATPDGLKKYYHQLFQSNRAALVITGGIEHEKALKLADDHFGKWQAGETADNNSELPAIKNGYVLKKVPVKQAYLLFDFLSQKISLDESIAMDLFGDMLGYGHTSLLYQELRHKKGLVYSISSYDINFLDANKFCIQTATIKPIDTARAIAEVLKSVEHITTQFFHELQEQEINIFLRRISDPLLEIKFLGELWTQHGRMVHPEEVIKITRELERDIFMAIKNKLVTDKNIFITILGPNEMDDAEAAEIFNVFSLRN